MGNDPLGNAYNFVELGGGISSLIKNIAGNSCKKCGDTFIPYKKNDDLCDNCRIGADCQICYNCESSVTFCYEDHYCYNCFKKLKKPCIKCGTDCIPDDNRLCRYCSYRY